jgi:MFS family permease
LQLARAQRRPQAIGTSSTAGTIIVDRSDSFRALAGTGLLGRFVVLCFGIWLHATDTLVTATIAPAIVETLGGVAFINWTITLYEIGAIVAGAAVPMLCGRLGVKRVLRIAALLYGAGCVIAGVAPAMIVLLAGRLAQGAGGGMLLSLCYLAVQQWFAQTWWNRLFGIVAVIWGAGSLLGPLIGGIFAALHVWRMTFVVFAVEAAVLWVMAGFWLPAHTPSAQTAKPWAVLPLIVLSAATVLIATSAVTGALLPSIGGTVIGAGLLYGAARLDRRASSRLFPRRLLEFRHPVGAGLAMVFALSAATTGFWAYGPLLLKILFGTEPIVSGYILAGEAVAWSLATVAVSKAPISADRWLIRIGTLAVVLGAGGFALSVPAGALPGIVVCALLQGLGFGLCCPSIVHRLTRFADESERPLAVTSPDTMQRIGYAVGTAAVGIAANLSGLAADMSIAAAKAAAFWVFAAFVPVMILGLLGAWIFTRDAEQLPNAEQLPDAERR